MNNALSFLIMQASSSQEKKMGWLPLDVFWSPLSSKANFLWARKFCRGDGDANSSKERALRRLGF